MNVRMTDDERWAIDALIAGVGALYRAADLLGVRTIHTLDRARGYGRGVLRETTAQSIRLSLRRLLEDELRGGAASGHGALGT